MADERLRENLRTWIALDDEARRIQNRLKEIRQQKTELSEHVLGYMRENALDDFRLEGQNESVISRQVRTIKPAIKRNTIRTQLLLHFADQPSRVAEALRAIEGIPEGQEDMSVGTQRELLTRRVPRQRSAAPLQLEPSPSSQGPAQ